MKLLGVLLFLAFIDEVPRGEPDSLETVPKYFRRVDNGPSLSKIVSHDGTGDFIRAVRLNEEVGDTLKIYVQGVTADGRVEPNRKRAKRADVVIWCYPSRYPHPKHVFPDAKGRIRIQENPESGMFIVFNKLP